MAKIVVCDWRDQKGNPCGERADVLVTLTWEGKRYEVDLCSQLHAKSLTANAREAEAPPSPPVTRIPTASTRATGRKVTEQLVDKDDYPDLRAWLVSEKLIKSEAKGRIKVEYQQRWLDAGCPREVADGTFKPSS